ncbi:hypothetical protein NI389_15760 [Pseudoalteromonas xiamenensis]|uniref:hypothetical protein n=1 Tax=Pseudoalteromonas xiamenensis TaxID=882626 RepID=UPI0027E51FB9|nr:hypothetical protein [Pseudoalteromonas xiamenensis]WMN59614.1 hypothetical protein NI389_15760 [Pseudoalteromonas xiamenensis]
MSIETCPNTGCGKKFSVEDQMGVPGGSRESEDYNCPYCLKHAGSMKAYGIPVTSKRDHLNDKDKK